MFAQQAQQAPTPANTLNFKFTHVFENGTNYKTITFHNSFKNATLEELHLADLMAGYVPAQQPAAPATNAPGAGGLFGTTPTAQPSTGGLFGAAAPSTGGLFGATPAAPAPTGGLFGATPAAPATTGGLFGTTPAAPAATGGLFGAPAQAPAATGGLFGAAPAAAPAATGGLFGAPAQAPAATGGLFGAAPAAAPAATGGLFGAAPAAAPAATGGLFGAPAQAPATTGGLFGGAAAAPAATGGLFGGAAAAAPAATGGLFGGAAQAPAATGGLFGGAAAAAPAAGGGLFGGATGNTAASVSAVGGLFGGVSNMAANVGGALGNAAGIQVVNTVKKISDSPYRIVTTPVSLPKVSEKPSQTLTGLKAPADKQSASTDSNIPGMLDQNSMDALRGGRPVLSMSTSFVFRKPQEMTAKNIICQTPRDSLKKSTGEQNDGQYSKTSSISDMPHIDQYIFESFIHAPSVKVPEGVSTVPSISELSNMKSDDLKKVNGFKIFREGVGSVTFKDPVDISGLDLSEVFEFPKEGIVKIKSFPKGLNVRCTVVIQNCCPENLNEKEIETVVKRSGKLARNLGATNEDVFDLQNRTLTFELDTLDSMNASKKQAENTK